MPDQIWAVFLGIICGILFLNIAKNLENEGHFRDFRLLPVSL